MRGSERPMYPLSQSCYKVRFSAILRAVFAMEVIEAKGPFQTARQGPDRASSGEFGREK
jgi:hypothetical protein